MVITLKQALKKVQETDKQIYNSPKLDDHGFPYNNEEIVEYIQELIKCTKDKDLNVRFFEDETKMCIFFVSEPLTRQKVRYDL